MTLPTPDQIAATSDAVRLIKQAKSATVLDSSLPDVVWRMLHHAEQRLAADLETYYRGGAY